MRGRRFNVGMREFIGWLARLFRQPVFLFVTAWGHLSIFGSAVLFRHFEQSGNQKISLFDAYYWAISTATTTGMADIAPATNGGKMVAIALMIIGSLFLWSYAALFAASVMVPNLRQFGREVKELEAGMEEMERDVRLDQATMQKLLFELEKFNSTKGRLR